MPSRTADETIAKAQLCYELDLITQDKLEHVVKRAETEPGYNDIFDLPFEWQIEHEQELRKVAESESKKRWWKR